QNEISKAAAGKINVFLKVNKKDYKWHAQAITFLIDKAGFGDDKSADERASAANYQTIKESLESVNLLLATLGDIKPCDYDAYVVQDLPAPTTESFSSQTIDQETKTSFFDQVESDSSSMRRQEPEPVKE